MDTKTSCTHCGQHILIDSTAIGQQVVCPTCSRPFTIAGNSPTHTPQTAPRKDRSRPLWLAAGGVVCILLATLGFLRFGGVNSRQPSPSSPSTAESIAPAGGLVGELSAKAGTAITNAPPLKTDKIEPDSGSAGQQEVSASWTNDWSAFAREISKQVQKSNDGVPCPDPRTDHVHFTFEGKTVEWTGTIARIDSQMVVVDMKPEKLLSKDKAGKEKAADLDRLVMTPAKEEWETWKSVRVGDTVVFRTTLADGAPPWDLLMFMHGQGSNAGQLSASIQTKGAACLKVHKSPGQPRVHAAPKNQFPMS